MPERDKEEESPEFKVVDRRLFTPEGERRPEAEPEPARPAKSEAPPSPGSPKQGEAPPRAAAEPPPQPHAGVHGPVSFEHLVMSLATTAMFQLGLVRSPDEDNPPVDLPAAKETIDLLEILQKKTQGNLTKEEEGLLEGSLYELRMVFVELSKPGRGR